MLRSPTSYGLVVAGMAALCLSACAGRAPRRQAPTIPALSATMSELLDRLSALDRQAPWRARAALRYEERTTGKSHEVDLRLAGRKPSSLRLQGTKTLLPTLFVLVANDDGMWLDVPSKKKTYHLPGGAEVAATGRSGSLMRLNPEQLLGVLTPDPPQPDERWALVEEPLVYVLTAFHQAPDGALRPVRELRFERRALTLARIRLFGDRGQVLSDALLGRRPDGAVLPETVRLERPFSGVILSFRFSDAVTAELGDAAFRFRMPAGRELVDVSAAGAALPAGLPGSDEEEDDDEAVAEDRS